jgi:hypothetical protein
MEKSEHKDIHQTSKSVFNLLLETNHYSLKNIENRFVKEKLKWKIKANNFFLNLYIPK